MGGQNVLNQFIDTLKARLRITDTCCRYDLNRIVAIMDGVDNASATQLCRRLTQEISSIQLASGMAGSEKRLRISAGIAGVKEEGNLEDAVAAAVFRRAQFCDFQVRE